MPALWRLYRARYGPGLDGLGGTLAGGRWHHRGERIVYFGSSAAIVILERLAHTDPDLLPEDLVLARFETPSTVSETRVEDVSSLPANWTHAEAKTRGIGTKWLRSASSCLLAVPSAIVPEESNFVLNAQHPDASLLKLVRERRFAFDSRLL